MYQKVWKDTINYKNQIVWTDDCRSLDTWTGSKGGISTSLQPDSFVCEQVRFIQGNRGDALSECVMHESGRALPDRSIVWIACLTKPTIIPETASTVRAKLYLHANSPPSPEFQTTHFFRANVCDFVVLISPASDRQKRLPRVVTYTFGSGPCLHLSEDSCKLQDERGIVHCNMMTPVSRVSWQHSRGTHWLNKRGFSRGIYSWHWLQKTQQALLPKVPRGNYFTVYGMMSSHFWMIHKTF